MQEQAQDFEKELQAKFGERVRFSYTDIFSDEIHNYPDIVKILDQVRLPLIALNGKPRFHGGLFVKDVQPAIIQLLD
jgi:hypothetical protein